MPCMLPAAYQKLFDTFLWNIFELKLPTKLISILLSKIYFCYRI